VPDKQEHRTILIVAPKSSGPQNHQGSVGMASSRIDANFIQTQNIQPNFKQSIDSPFCAR